MNRDEVHLRDRLMMLAESTKPFNVKRKSLNKQTSKGSSSKLTMQDFVRMDPSYTPDIEHLVFPARKRNPQQVAPVIIPPSSSASSSSAAAVANKTRSRLAEMFALSRHLQQRSADRETIANTAANRRTAINRSVDSVLEAQMPSGGNSSRRAGNSVADRRGWTTVEEPVQHLPKRRSPNLESDMSTTTRGPNVSVLHLRSTSEPWETSSNTSSVFVSSAPRSYRKQESLGGYQSSLRYGQQHAMHTRSDTYSGDMYVAQSRSYSRELSPVRWCDREVDGIYLGRSGWVQVQHRSLDESRRQKLPPSDASRRTGMKLAEYQLTNPLANMKKSEPQRPAYLPLKDYKVPVRSPSPPPPLLPVSFSPPPITPIISPPPAFQDRANKRSFFGKTPFLPRSEAIVDSDNSPPPTPPLSWRKSSSLPAPVARKSKTPSPVKSAANQKVNQNAKIPQTKSLEDTSSTNRRSLFMQKQENSSSSSSQSQSSQSQFRSLDSYVSRMPRLSENTDSSIDVYEDADDEDNNSSSLNISLPPTIAKPIPVRSEKISPSSRNSRLPYRRRSPVTSDTTIKANSPGSSSSSSTERMARPSSRSPSGSSGHRRTPPGRQYPPVVEDPKVRRSRSLQLPDKNYRNAVPEAYRVIKVTPGKKYIQNDLEMSSSLDDDMTREAEVVTNFIYGSRSRAAAQALLQSRYEQENGSKRLPLQRGHTTPTNPNPPVVPPKRTVTMDSPVDYEYWPQYRSNHPMRSSQSYPTHQRSVDDPREPYKKRVPRETKVPSPVNDPNRLSPNFKVGTRSPNRFKSSSSSSSEYVVVNRKSSGASTPLEEHSGGGSSLAGKGAATRCGEVILTRPGSAPGNRSNSRAMGPLTEQQLQHRSMSLPKSFLSHRQGGQFPWRRRGTESLGSSPGFRRRTPIETSQTAPVTPLHESGLRGTRRSPMDGGGNNSSRRPKASSTPQLIDEQVHTNSSGQWKTAGHQRENSIETNKETRKSSSGDANAESVLQKFRKSFSLRFQRKDSSKNLTVDSLSELDDEQSPSKRPLSGHNDNNGRHSRGQLEENVPEQKQSRFGPLVWRSSKDRKKLNKAARSMKCNSGDSGIQIEMVPGCGSINGGADSSAESHDTDPQDSPPPLRRRAGQSRSAPRPHSDLLNQILIDRFKAELRSRTPKHQHVRRTHSDLGTRRIYGCWDNNYRRHMNSSSSPASTPSPQHHQNVHDEDIVQMRNHPLYRRGQLRRSLSQPLDLDKLSPTMKPKLVTKISVLSEDEHDIRMGVTSDEETMSDSESSLASLDRKKTLDAGMMDDEVVILAEAVFDHIAIDSEELAFRAGDVIEVLDTTNRDWWWGTASQKSGWFPADSVRLRVSQEDTVEDCLAAMAAGKPTQNPIRRRTSISLLSNDQVRTSVVRELVHTERDFVKVLRDVAEGYLAECRKREDMFTSEQIDTIFMNLEEILRFQGGFLKDLEAAVDWDSPHKSCVGACFLRHEDGFKMYSDYCNSHPMAIATLQELYQYNNYSKFFEACRLLRGLIEIPLDGYLLTPVQRICKYPLQLAELLKYSKPDHPDYDDIKEALDAMKGVAVLINERKRRMESLEKIEAWQQRVYGWEGEDVIEKSSQLIHQGEVMRVTTGMWTSTITLFLFDKQLVYCKKDILKRNTYIYKGRICLDTSEVIDVPDGKDVHLGVTVRHAIKLYSLLRDKWLLFCCRSLLDKQKWLQAFAEERKLVSQDKSIDLHFPASSRHLAKIAARCQRRPPRKLRKKGLYSKRAECYMGSNLHLNNSNTNSLGRKVGTWLTAFGGGSSNGTKKQQHRKQRGAVS